MARFARIDSQIRANRLILANRFRVPELNPFVRIALRGGGGVKIANRRFEAIRANRSHVMKIDFLLRIDSPGHLRQGMAGMSHDLGREVPGSEEKTLCEKTLG